MKATLRDLVPRRRRLPDLPRSQLTKPIWWRLLRWCAVRYLTWSEQCVREELEGQLAMAAVSGGKYRLSKEYVHNCAVQREALRDKIARWNR